MPTISNPLVPMEVYRRRTYDQDRELLSKRALALVAVQIRDMGGSELTPDMLGGIVARVGVALRLERSEAQRLLKDTFERYEPVEKQQNDEYGWSRRQAAAVVAAFNVFVPDAAEEMRDRLNASLVGAARLLEPRAQDAPPRRRPLMDLAKIAEDGRKDVEELRFDAWQKAVEPEWKAAFASPIVGFAPRDEERENMAEHLLRQDISQGRGGMSSLRFGAMAFRAAVLSGLNEAETKGFIEKWFMLHGRFLDGDPEIWREIASWHDQNLVTDRGGGLTAASKHSVRRHDVFIWVKGAAQGAYTGDTSATSDNLAEIADAVRSARRAYDDDFVRNQ